MGGPVWWKSASRLGQNRVDFAFGKLAQGGRWSHLTTQSLYFAFCPSSGDLASRMLVSGARREFDMIPLENDLGNGGSTIYTPPASAADYSTLDTGNQTGQAKGGWYSEGYRFTGVYDGEYVLAQSSDPPGPGFVGHPYPQSPYVEVLFGPEFSPFNGPTGRQPQFLERAYHAPSLSGFELFPSITDSWSGSHSQTGLDGNLYGCMSFAGTCPRKFTSSPTPPGYPDDTYEFWYGIRSRVMTVGSGRRAFIAEIVFDFYIADPEINPGEGDILNRQYFIESAHIVEDDIMLINGQWKEIPFSPSSFDGKQHLVFLVAGETALEWSLRTGVEFT